MELQSSLSVISDRAKYLHQAKLIIWEELPMANKAAVECVNSFLQQLEGNILPFGGKLFLGLGDFRQVAPVVKGGGPRACYDASIRSSDIWKHFTVLRLHQPIRNASDPAYSLWVDDIGEGTTGSDESEIEISMINQLKSFDEIIAFLFPPEVLLNPQEVSRRSFLSPLNRFVDEFNTLVLDKIPFIEG